MDSNRIVGGIAAAEWKVLSNKEDSAVFFTQEQEGKPIILRVYSREMPAYEAVRQRPCAGLPRIYDCRWENGLFFVREQFIDGISLQEMIDGGELGKLKRVNWIITDWYRTQFYYDSGAWRATWAGEGGGVLLNQCPHQLDLVQWLCGMPCRVRAFLHEGKWHDIEVEDDVTAYLEYPNGATGVFITTTGDAPGTNRLEISGEMGKIVCENDKLTFYHNKVSDIEFCKSATAGFDKPECEIVQVETDGRNLQHVEVLNRFAAAILRGEALVANGREGINGLTLSNAMHLSSWLDKTVDLPFDEDLYLAELNKRRATSRAKEDKGITLNTEGSY